MHSSVKSQRFRKEFDFIEDHVVSTTTMSLRGAAGRVERAFFSLVSRPRRRSNLLESRVCQVRGDCFAPSGLAMTYATPTSPLPSLLHSKFLLTLPTLSSYYDHYTMDDPHADVPHVCG